MSAPTTTPPAHRAPTPIFCCPAASPHPINPQINHLHPLLSFLALCKSQLPDPPSGPNPSTAPPPAATAHAHAALPVGRFVVLVKTTTRVVGSGLQPETAERVFVSAAAGAGGAHAISGWREVDAQSEGERWWREIVGLREGSEEAREVWHCVVHNKSFEFVSKRVGEGAGAGAGGGGSGGGGGAGGEEFEKRGCCEV